MVKYKIKHIGWFFGFIWNCIDDLIHAPIDCFNEIGLWKENWQDFNTRIYFDTDPEAIELTKRLGRQLEKINNKEMKTITKLAIFDFDGTLVNTPLPEAGKLEYHVKTGSPWPHEGWWGRHESLDMAIFDMPTLEEVIEAYALETDEPTTAVVLLTGRLQKLSKHVKAILEAKNLTFDEYHFNRGGGTEFAKMKSMDELLEKYPEVTEMELWDDRLAHIPIFEDYLQKKVDSGRIKFFRINVVNGSHH